MNLFDKLSNFVIILLIIEFMKEWAGNQALSKDMTWRK